MMPLDRGSMRRRAGVSEEQGEVVTRQRRRNRGARRPVWPWTRGAVSQLAATGAQGRRWSRGWLRSAR